MVARRRFVPEFRGQWGNSIRESKIAPNFFIFRPNPAGVTSALQVWEVLRRQIYGYVYVCGRLGGVVVRTSDLWSRGRQLGHSIKLPGSLGQLSLPSLRLGESSTLLRAGVEAGRVHLRRVAGNSVIPHVRWRPVALFQVANCKVHSLQIPPPHSLLIPFLANSFPCRYYSLRIPLLDFLDKSIPCKFTRMRIVGPFLEYSFPCNFHPLSLQIQFVSNPAPPHQGRCTMATTGKNGEGVVPVGRQPYGPRMLCTPSKSRYQFILLGDWWTEAHVCEQLAQGCT